MLYLTEIDWLIRSGIMVLSSPSGLYIMTYLCSPLNMSLGHISSTWLAYNSSRGAWFVGLYFCDSPGFHTVSCVEFWINTMNFIPYCAKDHARKPVATGNEKKGREREPNAMKHKGLIYCKWSIWGLKNNLFSEVVFVQHLHFNTNSVRGPKTVRSRGMYIDLLVMKLGLHNVLTAQQGV